MNIFENELTWFIICGATVIITLFYLTSKIDLEKEKTKQIEMQLRVEMIKSGITNSLSIK